MTETRRGRAHWAPVSVVAPAAAATLALATGWALQHDPAPKPVAIAAPVTDAASHPDSSDRNDVALQALALDERDRVVALQSRLQRLQHRLHRVRNAPVPSWQAFVTTGSGGGSGTVQASSGSSGRRSSGSSSGGAARVAAPPRVAAAAPATHASTGAS